MSNVLYFEVESAWRGCLILLVNTVLVHCNWV